MAFANANFAAGPYTMTYDGTTVGLLNSDGIRHFQRGKRKLITVNQHGQTPVDGIEQGVEAFLQLTFKEWNAKTRLAMWPWSATLGQLGTVGVLTTSLTKAIVLTAVAGTPAASIGPATITYPYATLAEENDVGFLMACDERDIPILFRLLPDYNSGTPRFFVTTDP